MGFSVWHAISLTRFYSRLNFPPYFYLLTLKVNSKWINEGISGNFLLATKVMSFLEAEESETKMLVLYRSVY